MKVLFVVVVAVSLTTLVSSAPHGPPRVSSRLGIQSQVLAVQVQADRREPVLCGHENNTFTCSTNGVCVFDAHLNHTHCHCDHGYRGIGCSEKFAITKTLEGKMNASDAFGFRYILNTDSEAEALEVGGKRIENVSQNSCLKLCEDEMEVLCASVVYFPTTDSFNGVCHMTTQRHIIRTQDPSFSFSRGPEECYYGDGLSYRGFANTTISGLACQPWVDQTPHSHSRTAENYEMAGLTENYCRNPDGEDTPWCYTVDSDVRWEPCAVPACSLTTPTPLPTPTPTCPEACLLHGSCVYDENAIPTGECNCRPGYVNVLYSNCSESAPCENECSGHGECLAGLCKCDEGWEGGTGDCSKESVKCENDCSGHGRCEIETGVCACFVGWDGSSCTTELFVCANNCSGRGECSAVTGECVCNHEYTGPDCSEDLCPEGCSFHGVCDRHTRTCTCDKGYVGDACEEVEQPGCLNDCSGNGQCVGGRCFCNHGYSTEDCSQYMTPTCLNDCSNHGSCEDGVCDCDKHYSGKDCSVYTAPHYTPWPILAIIIPLFLVGAFVAWVIHVFYRIDMADGESEFAQLWIVRWLTGNLEKRVTVKEGGIPGSRVKHTLYE